jgi:hypothetical protein
MKKFFLRLINNQDIIYYIILVIICIWLLTKINSNVILLEGVGDDADNLRVLKVRRNEDPNSSFTAVHPNVPVKVMDEHNRTYWVFIPELPKLQWVWVNTRNSVGVMFNSADPRPVSINSASWGYLGLLNFNEISILLSQSMNDILHVEHLRGLVNYCAEKGNEALWKFVESNPNVPITKRDLSADPNIQEYKLWKYCQFQSSSKILAQIPNSVFRKDSLNEAYPRDDSSINVDLD